MRKKRKPEKVKRRKEMTMASEQIYLRKLKNGSPTYLPVPGRFIYEKFESVRRRRKKERI